MVHCKYDFNWNGMTHIIFLDIDICIIGRIFCGFYRYVLSGESLTNWIKPRGFVRVYKSLKATKILMNSLWFQLCNKNVTNVAKCQSLEISDRFLLLTLFKCKAFPSNNQMKSNVYKDEELELLQGSMIEEDCQTWSHFYLKYSSRPRWLSWCVVLLETRRSRVQPLPRSATFFRGDWLWNIFYGHSLPSADSRRTVISFRRKNVHNTG